MLNVLEDNSTQILPEEQIESFALFNLNLMTKILIFMEAFSDEQSMSSEEKCFDVFLVLYSATTYTIPAQEKSNLFHFVEVEQSWLRLFREQ